MKKILFLLSIVTFVLKAQSEEISYEISTQTPASRMLQFSIPYSMGVHEGHANVLKAEVVTDENDKVIRAHFQVPISSMKTGNRTRDCHMREALGINYEQSQFPKEHVCDSNNEIPSSGPDSIQYPEISLDFQEMSLPSEPLTLGVPKLAEVEVKIQIHGVEKILALPVMITKSVNSSGNPGFHLASQFTLSLRDFKVKVKPVEIFGMKIGVGDQIKVQTAIDLTRK